MRQTPYPVFDIFDYQIKRGDIIAEIHNRRLLYCVVNDFTFDPNSKNFILKCKKEGYGKKKNGDHNYGVRNIPFSVNFKAQTITNRDVMLITNNYLHKHSSGPLYDLHAKIYGTDWPVFTKVKTNQKPFFEKWIKSVKKYVEKECTGSSYRYYGTSFRNTHDNTSYTTIIKKDKWDNTLSFSISHSYTQLGSFNPFHKIHGDVVIDGFNLFKEPEFLKLYDDTCKKYNLKR